MDLREPSKGASGEARRARKPLDAEWLEGLALRYAARWESSAAGVRAHLDRRIRQRCDETGEDPADVIRAIPGIVERLVGRGYVNDERFAEQTIKRLRREGRSSAQIDARLRAKGISEILRQKLIEADDEAGGRIGQMVGGKTGRRMVGGWTASD